jgi:hypothetical protein
MPSPRRIGADLGCTLLDLHHIATPKSNKANGRNESVPIPKLDVAGSIAVSRTLAKEIRQFTGSIRGVDEPKRELNVVWLHFYILEWFFFTDVGEEFGKIVRIVLRPSKRSTRVAAHPYQHMLQVATMLPSGWTQQKLV